MKNFSFPTAGYLAVLLAALHSFPLSSPVLGQQPTPSETYSKGLYLLRMGKVLEACKVWKELLYKRRSQLNDRQVRTLEKRLSLTDESMALSKIAAGGLVGRAEDLCRESLKLLKSSGTKQQGVKKLRRAVDLLEQAAPWSSSFDRYFYTLGFALLYTGRVKAAMPVLKESVKRRPGDPRPLNLLAEAYRQQGDRDRQIACLDRSLAINPKQQKVCYLLAKALLKRGTGDDIDRAFRAARLSIGDNKARAEELAALFPDPEQRNSLESMAAEIAIRQHRSVRSKNTYLTVPCRSSGG